MKISKATLNGVVAILMVLVCVNGAQAEERINAKTILKSCYYKSPGRDQRSNMTITLKDVGGKPQVSKYLRLWKNYEGDGDKVDRVVLFTTFPPHQKDLSFMRWGYTIESGKAPEMWVYLPTMRKIRRLSQRDPASKAWVIKDEDLRVRELDEDSHWYKGAEKIGDSTYHLVEFRPKSDPVYGKRIAWFQQDESWDDCVLRKVDFYDKSGAKVKQQHIEWVKIKDAWAWKKVSIESRYGDAYIHYDMSDIEIDVGLDDDVFTRYTMKRGYRE